VLPTKVKTGVKYAINVRPGHRNSERSQLDKLDDQRFYVCYPAVQLNGGRRQFVG
jgi:hypothetical protein